MSVSIFRNIFAMIVALIMSLFNSVPQVGGNGGNGGNYPPAEPPADPPEVVLAIEYSNFAWGFQQDVTVVTSEGTCFRKSVSIDGYSWAEIEKLSVNVNDYSALVGLTKDAANAVNEKKDMNTVWTFYPKFSEWNEMPFKDYDVGACDYGTRMLYGFYKENGEVKRVEIASTGDWQSCVDDKDAIAFANIMLPRLPGFDFT